MKTHETKGGAGPGVLYGLEDRLPWGMAFFVGFQHFLAIFAGVITPSLVLCSGLGASSRTLGLVMAASLVASGVSTWIQIHRIGPLGSGLLSIQGTSGGFIAVLAGMGAALTAQGATPEEALGLMMGTAGLCALVEVGLSFALPLARKVLTPVVGGTVILLIGLTLVSVAARKFGGGAAAITDGTFGSGRHLALGLVSMGTVLAFNRLPWGWCRTGAALFGILAGMVLAAAMGMLPKPPPMEYVVALPRPLPFRLGVSWAWMVPMAVMYVCTTVETIGDITATCVVSGEPVEGELYERRLAGGILADGVNSMLAVLVGSFPTTSFGQNNGVIQLTGVASRRCGMAVGALLVVAGLFGAVTRFFMRVPEAVVGGVCLVLFSLVAVTGVRLLGPVVRGNREMLTVAAGLGAGLAVAVCPDALGGLPECARPLFGSSVVTGTLAALAAQAILGRTPGVDAAEA